MVTFQLVLAYSFSQNIIKSAEISLNWISGTGPGLRVDGSLSPSKWVRFLFQSEEAARARRRVPLSSRCPGPIRLILYSACSTSFFSRNSVFSHNNLAGTVFLVSFSQISDQRTEQIPSLVDVCDSRMVNKGQGSSQSRPCRPKPSYRPTNPCNVIEKERRLHCRS